VRERSRWMRSKVKTGRPAHTPEADGTPGQRRRRSSPVTGPPRNCCAARPGPVTDVTGPACCQITILIGGGHQRRDLCRGAEVRVHGRRRQQLTAKAGPTRICLIITPQHLEFRGRGLLRLHHLGPWTAPRGQVKEVCAKRRRNLFPPILWNVEIFTTDPTVWWMFWSPQRPEPSVLSMEERGYPVDWTPHNWAGAPLEWMSSSPGSSICRFYASV
jgi:hypothetical protein